MGHNLNYNSRNNEYAFVSAREQAWHKLGQVIEKDGLTSEEALIKSHLDYNVSIHDIFRDDDLNVESHKELRRDDTQITMGIVGKGYTIVQNKDCFDFFSYIAEKQEAIIQTAGALGEGEVIFITAKLPKEIVIAGTDLIENYIVLVNSFNMSYAFSAYLTPIRVVCNNTLNFSLSGAVNRIYLKHTTHIQSQLFEASRMLGMYTQHMAKFDGIMNHFAQINISDHQAHKIIHNVFLNKKEMIALAKEEDVSISKRKENIIEEVMKYYHSTDDLNHIRGTAWGVLNGITGYYQHIKNFSNEELKFKSIVLGGDAYSKQQAVYKELLKLS